MTSLYCRLRNNLYCNRQAAGMALKVSNIFIPILLTSCKLLGISYIMCYNVGHFLNMLIIFSSFVNYY
jgi:hypothetical protein